MTKQIYNFITESIFEADIVEQSVWEILKKISIRSKSVKFIDNFIDIVFEKNSDREEFVGYMYDFAQSENLKNDILGKSDTAWVYTTDVSVNKHGLLEHNYGLRFLASTVYIILKTMTRDLEDTYNENKIFYKHHKKNKNVRTKIDGFIAFLKALHIRYTVIHVYKDFVEISFCERSDSNTFLQIFLKDSKKISDILLDHIMQQSCECHKWSYDIIIMPCTSKHCDISMHTFFTIRIPLDDITDVVASIITIHQNLFGDIGKKILSDNAKTKKAPKVNFKVETL